MARGWHSKGLLSHCSEPGLHPTGKGEPLKGFKQGRKEAWLEVQITPAVRQRWEVDKEVGPEAGATHEATAVV